MNSTLYLPATIVLALAPVALAANAQDTVDEALPAYHKSYGVLGDIRTEGSDTMNNVMALWAESFQRHYPTVQLEIQGKGSATAPAALIEGTSTFGPMSREMKAAEVDAFRKAFGYEPTALRTSIDMVALYVHKDNPISSLSLHQIDAIFSRTRNGGFESDIRTWGDLGLTDAAWKDQPIRLYGRNSTSGTYGFFKEHALFDGDFKETVEEQAGNAAVVSAVATDRFGLGYAGIGYRTADVRALPIASEHGEEAVAPAPANAYDGSYPLARFLLIYLNLEPGTRLEPLRREFIRYVFSRNGQADVLKEDHVPIPATIAVQELAKVGLGLDGRVLEVGLQDNR